MKKVICSIFFLVAVVSLKAQHPSIGGYNVYYGILHNHTNVSDGRGTPEDAYDYAKNVAGLDYFSISDHIEMMDIAEWDTTKKVAEKYNEDGVFTTFWGFEWTNGDGDVTVINSVDNTNMSGTSSTFPELCAWLNTRDCVAFFNHPGLYNWNNSSNDYDRFVTKPTDKIVGIELFNRTNGFEKYFYNDGFYPNDGNLNYFSEANSRGWRIGASGSDDNHEASWGTLNNFRMAILANQLSRSELFSALQSRRFYSTEDKNLALSFKFGTAEMGSTLGGGAYDMYVQANDKDGESFIKIVLYRNGIEMKTWDINTPNIDFSLPVKAFNGEFFYVKVTQADGNEAVSSPIFIKGGAFNIPPSCSLSAPENGSHFNSPHSISISALASDADGSVVSVEFFVNGKYVGSDNLAPYSINYIIPTNGSYQITAKVTDEAGSWTISPPVNFTVGSFTETVISRIERGSDDVEEVSTGHYMPASSDIEFDQDLDEGAATEHQQWAGFRFTEITIPKNATITEATIQFTSKSAYNPSYPDSKVWFKIQDSDNAEAFPGVETTGTKLYQVTDRAYLADSVIWDVPQWLNADEADIDQLSPDLKVLVQAIVKRPGWASGNALGFMLGGNGTGWRNTRSYEANPSQAAILKVAYTIPTGVNELKKANIGIYPNPVKGDKVRVILDGFNNTGFVKLSLWDISGREVYRINIGLCRNVEIPVKSFRPGIYLIRVQDADQVVTSKLVIYSI